MAPNVQHSHKKKITASEGNKATIAAVAHKPESEQKSGKKTEQKTEQKSEQKSQQKSEKKQESKKPEIKETKKPVSKTETKAPVSIEELKKKSPAIRPTVVDAPQQPSEQEAVDDPKQKFKLSMSAVLTIQFCGKVKNLRNAYITSFWRDINMLVFLKQKQKRKDEKCQR